MNEEMFFHNKYFNELSFNLAFEHGNRMCRERVREGSTRLLQVIFPYGLHICFAEIILSDLILGPVISLNFDRTCECALL